MSQWNNMLKLKGLPYGGVYSISDPVLEDKVKEITANAIANNCLEDDTVHTRFVEEYKQWLLRTNNNKIIGLENFNTAAFCNGTTEAFDKFYLKHKSRRLRFFKGEYMYHVAVAKTYFSSVVYLEDEPLLENDVVVISYPFSNSGNKHQGMDSVLSLCNKLKVPVLIDCAYMNISGELEYNFNYNCIEEIVFSLSKTFPVGYLRIGMRLTREDNDDPLLVYNKNKYVNRLSAAVGLELIKQYHPDYNFDSYRSNQLKFCKELGVDPSNTVVFGLSTSEYPEYNRGGKENRLCFSKFLNKGQL